MDLQDLGAIGEFVSSIAVLVTLIYLAIQVRETRKALMAETYQARSNAQQDALLRGAENPDLAEINLKVFGERSTNLDREILRDRIASLTPLERQRFRAMQRALMERHDNVAFQIEHGNIPSADVANILSAVPFFAMVWDETGINLKPSIQRYIDTLEESS